MSDPDVTIIAVSYFGSSDAQLLASSLRQQHFQDWQLLLVDNTTDVEEARRLAEIAAEDGRVRVLSPGSNLGYFGAAQFALDTVAFEGDAIVMNTDIVFSEPRVLGRMRTESLSDKTLGAIAPAVISSRSHRDQNPHLTRLPSVRSSSLRRWATATPLLTQLSVFYSDMRRRVPQTTPIAATPPTMIYAAHGSCIYLTDRYFKNSGDFKHHLFLFGEEIYVAEHVRRNGLAVRYLPAARMNHVEHGSMGMQRSRFLLKLSGRATKYALQVARSASQEQRANPDTAPGTSGETP